jgi:hypothetical protein
MENTSNVQNPMVGSIQELAQFNIIHASNELANVASLQTVPAVQDVPEILRPLELQKTA